MAASRLCGLFAMLFALPAVSAADVLVTDSGDRLTGKLVERRDGVLVFDSELLGRVEVPAERARIEPGASAEAPATTTVAAVASDAASPPTAPGWTSDVGARLSLDRGNLESAEDDVRVSVKNRRPTRHGLITSSIDYHHKTTDGELKNDDAAIKIGYERFLSDRTFVAGRALATREAAGDDYDQSRAALVSAGWRWWEGQGHYLRAGPAVGYLDVVRTGGQFDGPAVGLYATAEGPAWAGLRFSSELAFLDTLGDGRYVNLELRLQQPLGKRLYVALVWDYAWSDFDIESGVRSEWRWDLGWRFGPEPGR